MLPIFVLKMMSYSNSNIKLFCKPNVLVATDRIEAVKQRIDRKFINNTAVRWSLAMVSLLGYRKLETQQHFSFLLNNVNTYRNN